MSPGLALANNHKITLGVISLFTILFVIFYFVSLAQNSSPKTAVKSVEGFFAEFEMNFQGNEGNFASEVKYYSKGYQYDLMFMNNEVLLNLYSTQLSPPGSSQSKNNKTRLSQVSLEFVGANNAPKLKGLSKFSATTVSSPVDQEASPSINSFAEIKYASIYPGIDVYFSGKQKQLFYEFVLSETADINNIVLKINGLAGAGQFDIDMHGNINVNCHGKQMQIKKPEVYRMVNQQKEVVNGYFIVTPKNEIHFKLAGDLKLS